MQKNILSLVGLTVEKFSTGTSLIQSLDLAAVAVEVCMISTTVTGINK